MICGRVKTDTGDHEQQAGPYRFQEVDRPGERATVPRSDPPPWGCCVENHSRVDRDFKRTASTGKPVLIELPSITGQAGLKQFRI